MEFVLLGQMPSGKNAVKITQTGKRYPEARFVKWREGAFEDLRRWKVPSSISNETYLVCVDYYPGDFRRRDAPGIIDALCHLLERWGFVSDDCLLEDWEFKKMPLDRENPRAVVRIFSKYPNVGSDTNETA
jgi:hypothetical protein